MKRGIVYARGVLFPHDTVLQTIYAPLSSVGGVVMDWSVLIQFIQGVGFPIACVLIMFQQMDKERESHKEESAKMTEALNNNTLILTELKQKLEDITHET